MCSVKWIEYYAMYCIKCTEYYAMYSLQYIE